RLWRVRRSAARGGGKPDTTDPVVRRMGVHLEAEMTWGRSGRLVRGAATIAVVALVAGPGYAQGRGGRGGDQITSIEERTSGLKKMDGFFPLYWDEAAGRLWMEVPKLDTEVLYSTGFGAG